ncbi:hypothetical protein GJ744_011190 [Endocarpon pusillum]|uniref:Uncharacterized protein n=1 Tax=Endocarpon pusillum TaxID=364733 RepID=A0A8H7E191_9EURO|nr:hypothetical protein GJ744_011190 [Endocarpon pusillum]
MLSVTITLLAAAATVSAQGIVPPYMTSFQPAPTPCLGGPQSCYTSTVTGPNPAALYYLCDWVPDRDRQLQQAYWLRMKEPCLGTRSNGSQQKYDPSGDGEEKGNEVTQATESGELFQLLLSTEILLLHFTLYKMLSS